MVAPASFPRLRGPPLRDVLRQVEVEDSLLGVLVEVDVVVVVAVVEDAKFEDMTLL